MNDFPSECQTSSKGRALHCQGSVQKTGTAKWSRESTPAHVRIRYASDTKWFTGA
jgi:hypothetical protein